jgi:tetratricopeptide (TPR) repeat protein
MNCLNQIRFGSCWPGGLLLGCALAAGCSEPVPAVTQARIESTDEIPPCSEIHSTTPLPLQRVEPPNLVQLTEFSREQFPAGDLAEGPQLALPALPQRFEANSATDPNYQVGIGETFRIVDEDTAKPPRMQNRQEAVAGQDQTRRAEPVAGTALPWGPSTPSSEMFAIAQRAEEMARRGYDLAQRGGLYSARAKFTESLRVLAEALDAQRQTTAHTQSLAAGLRALEEVDDFVPRGVQFEADMNLPLIVDAHRTPVLKNRPLDGMTPLTAQRVYLTFAQEQLAAAGGDQSVASLALHGLGKICITPAQMNGPQVRIAEAKAVVYFQAAVLIEPRNFLSANELGVLLAKFGRLEDARHAIEQSVANSNSPTAWQNLAVVNERLGDQQKAAICRQRIETAIVQSRQAGTNNGGSQYMVRWVDPETFAQSNSMAPITAPAAGPSSMPRAASHEPTTATATTAAKPETKSSGWKWPWQ